MSNLEQAWLAVKDVVVKRSLSFGRGDSNLIADMEKAIKEVTKPKKLFKKEKFGK